MKTLLLITIFSLVSVIQAATVRLSFSGAVDEVLLGEKFPIGSNFQFSMDYPAPLLAGLVNPSEFIYSSSTSSTLVIDGTTLRMTELFIQGNLEQGPHGDIWVMNWGAGNTLGAGSSSPFQFTLVNLLLRIPVELIDDPSRLPTSLEEWDLNGGTFEVDLFNEDDSTTMPGVSNAGSSTLSAIALGPVPEPSSFVLALMGVPLFFLRRR